MQILQGDDVGIIVPLSLSVQVNASTGPTPSHSTIKVSLLV